MSRTLVLFAVAFVACRSPPGPDPRCSRANCEAMFQCRVGLAGEPLAETCRSVDGGLPETWDITGGCVAACEAQAAGAQVDCIARISSECTTRPDSNNEAVLRRCIGMPTSAASACMDGCNVSRNECESTCPQSSFAECNECSTTCGLTAADCIYRCGF